MPNAIKKRRRQSDGSSKSDQVRALLAKGMSAGDIAKKVGCSTNLVYVVKSTGGAKGKRANGTRLGGRQPNGDSKSGQVRALLATGISAAEIAKKVGCTTGLVYVIKSKMGKSSKRGPGRPRKVATPGLDGLAGIIDAVKNTERERAQLRASLEKIQAVLADALA